MPTVKKTVVTRPTKKGGLSTYVQSYNVGSNSNKISDDIITSIKTQQVVNSKYLLNDYLRSLTLSNITVYDIKFIISKLININDIEILSEFIINNIDNLNLMVLCGILNNIPNKYEYYLILFSVIFEKLNVSDDILYSLLYSLNFSMLKL